MRFFRFALLFAFAGSMFAVAQEPKAAKKDPSLVPGPFPSYIVADQRTDPKDPKGKRNVEGKIHDLVAGNDLNPTIAVFATKSATKADEPIAKLTAKMKDLQNQYKLEELGTFVIFAVLDKDYANDANSKPAAEELRAWAKQITPAGVVLGLAEKQSETAKAWGVTPGTTSVIFYNRQKILKRWDLQEGDISEEVLAALAKEVEKEMKK